jgi:hypothetical protein
LPLGFQPVFCAAKHRPTLSCASARASLTGSQIIAQAWAQSCAMQVPVVNVPFRLIYAFNPNARRGVTKELPGFSFNERRSVFVLASGELLIVESKLSKRRRHRS